jgi:hypothetical protein
MKRQGGVKMGEGLKRAVAAAKATRSKKLQRTVTAPDYGNDTCNRLAVILVALSQMDPRERSATFGYLRASYADEWPRDSF